MDSSNDSDETTGREIAGVIMLFLGILGMAAVAVAAIGVALTLGLAAAAVVAVVGYRLATRPAESSGTGERDYDPDGPGPLYVDPDAPDQFIPRT